MLTLGLDTKIQAWIGSWPFMPWCGGRYDTSELGWYGSITLAREVALCHDGKLKFTPVQEVEKLRHSPKRHSQLRLSNGEKFAFEACALSIQSQCRHHQFI